MNNHDLRTQLAKLEAIDVDSHTGAAQRRGIELEELLHELFTRHKIFIRCGYHTEDNRSEQIDGAIRIGVHRCLVEVKWTTSNQVASDLFAFIGKVENKFVGTIGLFISYNTLTPNFLRALSHGRRRTVLVIHGNDINDIFHDDFDLPGYLEEYLDIIATDIVEHLSTERFKSKEVVSKDAKDDTGKTSVEPEWKSVLRDAMNTSDKSYLATSWTKTLDSGVAKEISDYIVNNWGGIKLLKEVNVRKNIESLYSALVSKFPALLGDVLSKIVSDRYSTKLGGLLDLASSRYPNVPQELRSDFEDNLADAWKTTVGDYSQENLLAAITDPIWIHLTKATQWKIMLIIADFPDSGRQDWRPQMRFAGKALQNTKVAKKKLFYQFLADKIAYWKDYEDKDWERTVRSNYIHKYEKAARLLGVDIAKSVEVAISRVQRQISDL